jgi:hypothetical protein
LRWEVEVLITMSKRRQRRAARVSSCRARDVVIPGGLTEVISEKRADAVDHQVDLLLVVFVEIPVVGRVAERTPRRDLLPNDVVVDALLSALSIKGIEIVARYYAYVAVPRDPPQAVFENCTA